MTRAKLQDRDLMKERAFDEAVAAVKASGFRTFAILYEADEVVNQVCYPDTAGTVKGLIDRILFVMTGKFF